MVRVIIERRCKAGKDIEMEMVVTELRTMATLQQGYISGETLRSISDPLHWVVISTWVDDDWWKVWETSIERCELQKKIETLLAEPEKVAVFSFFRHGGSKSAHTIDK